LNLSAEGAAKLFRDNIWKDHGWPQKIITDRGMQFAAKFVTALNSLLGITTALSTAYHPETDGQTEHVNQELEQYLQLYMNFMQTDWNEWLTPAEFAYNNHAHSSTLQSPFFLEYGRHPHVPTAIPSVSTINPAANNFRDKLTEAHNSAHKALQKTAESMKKFADKKR
jgi:hypothetical protein